MESCNCWRQENPAKLEVCSTSVTKTIGEVWLRGMVLTSCVFTSDVQMGHMGWVCYSKGPTPAGRGIGGSFGEEYLYCKERQGDPLAQNNILQKILKILIQIKS